MSEWNSRLGNVRIKRVKSVAYPSIASNSRFTSMPAVLVLWCAEVAYFGEEKFAGLVAENYSRDPKWLLLNFIRKNHIKLFNFCVFTCMTLFDVGKKLSDG